MNRMGIRVAGVLVAGLMVGATACGGGSSKDDASSGSSTAATSESSSGGGSNGAGDVVANALGADGDCVKAAAAFGNLFTQAMGAAFGASEADLQDMQNAVNDLNAEIPAEIKDDFDTYSAGIQKYADALQGVSLGDILDPSVQQKLQDASASLDTPEMQQASDNIQKYFDANCPN